MLAKIAADLLLLIHLGFILFVAIGGLLVLKWRKVSWLHIPCVLWGVTVELTGRICPLTPLENKLRIAAGETGYSGGFIEHYIMPIIYPVGLTQNLQLILGALLLVINVSIYSLVIIRTRNKLEN